MIVKVPYLQTEIALDIPGENLLGIVEPNDIEAAGAPREILDRALASPFGKDGKQDGVGLGEFLKGARSVLVIVNDPTRPTPTEAMLDALLPSLEGLELTVLVATGAHRAPTEREYAQILGRHHAALKGRIRTHDSRAEADLVELGTTRNGTPIVLNRLLFASDRIIATGSVEPHYFAGYTGGRKAFLPGVASFRTIEANHRLALSPMAASLVLEGNPVHADMIDALPLLKAPVFALMAVLDRNQNVAAATAGDIGGSFSAATVFARRIFCVSVPARADIVLSVARFPMDIDLYQGQKAIDNGAAAVADGGLLILVSSCRDGIGDKTYSDLLSRAKTPQEALELISGTYRLGYHKAAKMAALSLRARVAAKTEVDASTLRSMFIEPIEDLAQAVNDEIARVAGVSKRAATVLVLTDGCVTVPEVKS